MCAPLVSKGPGFPEPVHLSGRSPLGAGLERALEQVHRENATLLGPTALRLTAGQCHQILCLVRTVPMIWCTSITIPARLMHLIRSLIKAQAGSVLRTHGVLPR
jgi:hypothetical protein